MVLNGNSWMGRPTTLYKRYRFPPEIIQYAVWLYHRFNLSQRDIEDLLAERGIVDVFLQRRRDGKAAKRFFKRLLKNNGGEPRKIVTDKLRSYGVAHRELILDTIHHTIQYAKRIFSRVKMCGDCRAIFY